MSIESVMPFNHFIHCFPLLLLPSIFLSIRIFSKKSVLRIRWSKYWSFCFSIGSSKEFSGMISFRIDLFDLLEVQGTLRVFSSTQFKSSIIQRSVLFKVQLSHPYVTTQKTITDYMDLFQQSNVICFLICYLGLS